MAGKRKISADSGAVDLYVSSSPKTARDKLERLRTLIREAAPGAMVTTSYFEMPGYSYPGYDYNGMFAWFALKGSDIALYLRPEAIRSHRKELQAYETTKAIVRFHLDEEIPAPLVKRLVQASVKAMKRLPRKPTSRGGSDPRSRNTALKA